MKKYEYVYTIKQVDIQGGYLLVEYLPTDTSLLKYVYNVGAYYRNDSGELKTIDQIVEDNAPHEMWETQEMLLSNMSNILNKTGAITPNA